ncbi:Tropomyosin [Popillia japonica]|uniref:Tropomyosin n=1 Tax=Popillia japonica TaxID=7064 RepID=A0AAW1L5A3_POPJA
MSIPQGSLLDVLKKKMRQTKEEMERYKDECENYNIRYQNEVVRREEAESEVAALNRRIQLLEEDLERSEERLATATAKLAEASQAADESERIRKALENRTNMEDDRVAILESQLSQAKQIAEEADKKYEERKLDTICMFSASVFTLTVPVFIYKFDFSVTFRAVCLCCISGARKILENRSLADEERMDALENQLKEARFLAEEADKKYDEVARKLAMVEADLERAEERAEAGES